MVANHRDGIKAAVELLHHRIGVARPAADESALLGQLLLQDVATAAVRVLDPDLGRAGRDRSLTSGHALFCHPLGKLAVVAVRLARLVPVRRARDALDVNGDEDPGRSERCERTAGTD